jgi:hypothetical protein
VITMNVRQDLDVLVDVWSERPKFGIMVWRTLQTVCLVGMFYFAILHAVKGVHELLRSSPAPKIFAPNIVLTAAQLDMATASGGFGGRAETTMKPGNYYVDPSSAKRCGSKENPCRSMSEFTGRYGRSPIIIGSGEVTLYIGPEVRGADEQK